MAISRTRDIYRDPDDIDTIAKLNYQLSRYMDFLEYLFDHEITYKTHSEAFEEFEAWEEKQDEQD